MDGLSLRVGEGVPVAHASAFAKASVFAEATTDESADRPVFRLLLWL
jgi:hypothetical protein